MNDRNVSRVKALNGYTTGFKGGFKDARSYKARGLGYVLFEHNLLDFDGDFSGFIPYIYLRNSLVVLPNNL